MVTLLLIGGVVAVVVGVVAWWWIRSSRRTRSDPAPQSPPAADYLAKTRNRWGGLLGNLKSGSRTEFLREMEQVLLATDLGPAMSQQILAKVGDPVPADPAQLRELIRQELVESLSGRDRHLRLEGTPAVVVVVGVNGSGKTTTVAKLCAVLAQEGRRCLIAAADTFRAAADTQVQVWADRVGVDVVAGSPGADPAAVAFDALAAGRARGMDVVLVDTAGRLQDKQNLMAQLAKLVRVLGREDAPVSEILLVMDATTGQNGLAQARVFTDQIGVNGIVLTKLDGTAKGGVVVAIEQELGIPVKFLGLGEGLGDLIPFDGRSFVDGLLAE